MSKGVSRRLGCKVVGLSRNASRRERRDRRPELRSQIVLLAQANPRCGFRRVHALLDPGVNLKAVHRIWREEGLGLTTRKSKRIRVERTEEPVPTQFGEVWSIDFASEWLENRRQARIVGVLRKAFESAKRAWEISPGRTDIFRIVFENECRATDVLGLFLMRKRDWQIIHSLVKLTKEYKKARRSP